MLYLTSALRREPGREKVCWSDLAYLKEMQMMPVIVYFALGTKLKNLTFKWNDRAASRPRGEHLSEKNGLQWKTDLNT